MAKKKNKPTIDLDEVFIEPTLLERLFPTFVKSGKKTTKQSRKEARREKEKKKRQKKGSVDDLSLTFPIVNLLPRRFMLEVKRKRVARGFAAVYAVIFLTAGGVFFSNYTDITIAQNKLTSAEQRLTSMTSTYSSSAPTLAFVRDLRSNATLVNSRYSQQVNYSAVLSTLTGATPAGVTITNAAIASGGSEEVQCTTNVDDPFSATQQAPNTGCVVFSGTAGTIAATSDLSRALDGNPQFAIVSVTPGNADSENLIPFTGVITLTPEATLSGETLIDISGLPAPADPAAAENANPDGEPETVPDTNGEDVNP